MDLFSVVSVRHAGRPFSRFGQMIPRLPFLARLCRRAADTPPRAPDVGGENRLPPVNLSIVVSVPRSLVYHRRMRGEDIAMPPGRFPGHNGYPNH